MAFFAMVMSVALVTIERHHPFDRFGPANLLTAIRAVITALVAAMVGIGPSRPLAAFGAALLGLLVVVLDGVDGQVARRSGMTSAFGARFDMEVDALLILALAALVYRHQKAGAWVLASGLMRYAFVAGGMARAWLRRPLEPSQRRQTVCVIQIAALLIALAPFIRPPLSAWIAAAALAVLCWSFLLDLWWLWTRRVHA
jgi:phosphatidylglycerophosphate synthase